MKTHIGYSLFLLFVIIKLNGHTQQIYDTTTWESVSCQITHYSYKLPYNYHISGECLRLENVSTGYKRKPIWLFSELFRPSQYDFLKEKTSSYKKWKEWRASLVFDADGVDGSEQGDSIAKNINFINSQGIPGTELFVYVTKSSYQNKKIIKRIYSRGPIFIFNSLDTIEHLEPTPMFVFYGDQSDTTNEKILRLIIDTFKFIK